MKKMGSREEIIALKTDNNQVGPLIISPPTFVAVKPAVTILIKKLLNPIYGKWHLEWPFVRIFNPQSSAQLIANGKPTGLLVMFSDKCYEFLLEAITTL